MPYFRGMKLRHIIALTVAFGAFVALPVIDCATPATPQVQPPQSQNAKPPIPLQKALGSAKIHYTEVFGVACAAPKNVAVAKFDHMVAVLAEYLDNDENGVADDAQVVAAMTNPNWGQAMMILFKDENQLEQVINQHWQTLDQYRWQDLLEHETHPNGSSQQNGFDATLEEVLHLVSAQGYAEAYPTAFGEQAGTELTDAMDIARGGHFNSVPNNYPSSAWYHYDDRTCRYPCQATEYFYWLLTSLLGAQDYPGRGNEIDNEWEPNTPAKVFQIDTAGYALMTDARFNLPTILPDGDYR